MLLSQHLQQLALLPLPGLVILELPLPLLVGGDLCLFVVLEGPVLVPTHVPGVQQDLAGSVILRHHVNRQLVVLQDPLELFLFSN